MTSKRPRLWSAEIAATYWQHSQAAARRATAARYGEDTARKIHVLWQSLENDERALLEWLLLTERRSVVAAYDNELCNDLVAKRLLQIPPGVGTLLMQDLETTFKIPRAVWRELNEDKARFVPCSEPELGKRLAQLNGVVEHRLAGLSR